MSGNGAAAGRGDANALADGAAGAPPPSTTGTVALGHTECDVVRGIGAPDSVNLSNNPRGDRVAVVTYSRGQRAGIYTFTAGRLTSIERGPEPVAQPKAASKAEEEAGGDVEPSTESMVALRRTRRSLTMSVETYPAARLIALLRSKRPAVSRSM